MIRTITSEDLRDCARLFVKVFSEWPYEESWSVTQAHHYLHRFWKFDPDHRRRSGHGRRLVRHLLDKIGESKVSMSLIANEATPAAAFYEELGLRQHRYYKFYCGTVKTGVD